MGARREARRWALLIAVAFPIAGAAGCGSGSGAGAGDNGDAGSCATGQVPERYPPASCADPEWAAWPMPNDPVDVTAGAPNRDNFTDNGDGTITDNVTKLMWQKTPTSDNYTRDDAIAYCAITLNTQASALGGHRDWRLPTIIELTSIVDFGRPAPPAVDPTFTLVLMGSIGGSRKVSSARPTRARFSSSHGAAKGPMSATRSHARTFAGSGIRTSRRLAKAAMVALHRLAAPSSRRRPTSVG